MTITPSCDLSNVLFTCGYYIVLRHVNKDNEIRYFKKVKKNVWLTLFEHKHLNSTQLKKYVISIRNQGLKIQMDKTLHKW